MKKKTKIILISVISFLLLICIGLGIAGNYLYDLALNPNTDKSEVFNNKNTENKEDYHSTSTFFEDTKYEDKYINVDDLKLHAYDFNQGSDTYVVVIHGYMSEAKSMGVSAEHFYKQGYNVLAIDLRAHGLSQGDYIGMGWDERLEVVEWINTLCKQNKNYNIVLYGVSMGAATVMNTEGEKLPNNVKLAIEDCGYVSTWDIFKYQLDALFSLPDHPFLDAANVVTHIRAGYDLSNGPIDQIVKAKIPTLFIHGDEDTFVPFASLDKLYNAAKVEKEKLVIKGAGHGQASEVDPQLYWTTVDNFINKHLK